MLTISQSTSAAAHCAVGATVGLCLAVVFSGCMVGPNYARPALPTADEWIETPGATVRTEGGVPTNWWGLFSDPVLSRLIEVANAQNLTVQAAGMRVIEAQARRAITIGNLFPQQQALSASYARNVASQTAYGAAPGLLPRNWNSWQAGFDTVWELDLWGKFRRAVEASNADLIAASASYGDVLVSLDGEVASTYVTLRVLDERLAVAEDNVRVQHDSLQIARIRFEEGSTSDLDVEQATTLVRDTEATIPQLGILRRQAIDALCVLLGRPPQELTELLGANGGIVPQVPTDIAVGIPADLVQRRPDVRAIEQAAIAQSARIGVAKADLLPAFSLTGQIGFSSQTFVDFFEGRSFAALGGPSVTWPVLNYGRIINNVRLQDATFQELLLAYENTVLRAQQEVEDSLIGYLLGTEQVQRLSESVEAANRAVDISLIQYRQGGTDYTSVINTQQSKLRENDSLVTTRGAVALYVIALYKALGGGWDISAEQDFVPDTTRTTMEARTNWGDQLSPNVTSADLQSAQTDAQHPGGWHWWWPIW